MAATSTHIPDIPPEGNRGEEDERREEDCGVHGMGMLSGRTGAQEQTGGGEKNDGEKGDQRGDSGGEKRRAGWRGKKEKEMDDRMEEERRMVMESRRGKGRRRTLMTLLRMKMK